MDVSERYRVFADAEAKGNSRLYEQWCRDIANDTALLSSIAQLPVAKQQPNLVLAAARYLGAPEGPYSALRHWMLSHWDAVHEVAMARSTQTNEVGRAAAIMPILAQLPGPLSLIEVGASAGLCLYPDHFSYRYDGRTIVDPPAGRSEVILSCATSGQPPLPDAVPVVVYRAGVDLNPLDVNRPDDMRWLESLVWPGQPQRLDRLRAAAAIARRQPAHLVSGDLNDTVGELVSGAPTGSTIVVLSSAVLAYLTAPARERFARSISHLNCHWISYEAPGVVPTVADHQRGAGTDTPRKFVIALDGTPLALSGPHGQTLDWIGAS